MGFLAKFLVSINSHGIISKIVGILTVFNVAKTDSVITGDVNHIVLITDYLRNKHRDVLYNTLYEAGNDKSDIQKIWSVVKHIIPFYDCVEGIINKDIEHAVPACLIDAISFISVFGSVASLNGKFGMGLVRGGLVAHLQ
ncbi:hypothetical protein GMX10_17865 [Pectobacterium parvum]|uniref:Uncharacterized protein n=1 Tax=Pectobacterium parvum TaxID=2778550 RepID=A0AAP9LDY6_9GAMM|nr:hypothetical protein GMX10_17865 [Pectobacterium parvum]